MDAIRRGLLLYGSRVSSAVARAPTWRKNRPDPRPSLFVPCASREEYGTLLSLGSRRTSRYFTLIRHHHHHSTSRTGVPRAASSSYPPRECFLFSIYSAVPGMIWGISVRSQHGFRYSDSLSRCIIYGNRRGR
jgi:hypothetical protein